MPKGTGYSSSAPVDKSLPANSPKGYKGGMKGYKEGGYAGGGYAKKGMKKGKEYDMGGDINGATDMKADF